MVVLCDQASGIIRHLVIGADRPPRTSSSKALSSEAESELPGEMTGLISSTCLPNTSLAIRVSWLRIQLTLPDKVLISPL